MINKTFSLGKIKKDRILIRVKSSLCKFSHDGFCINNEINPAKQTLFI